ncbi:MAG TPA: hypothetical protein VM733_09400 [Thermoanaerobaculia bacterium]|nr:hypothetical protein [Thermoanaerobaculia bacterium]
MAGITMQEYIQQIMDGLYPKLNDPNSGDWYLPNFILKNKYDPYGPFGWDLGQLTDPGMLEAAAPICASIDVVDSPCGDVASYITATIPPYYPTLNIVGGLIGGLANAVLARPIAQPPDGMKVKTRADFGTLNTFPKPITIKGDWTFVNYCCCSNDQKTCSKPATPETGNGNFTATMPDPALGAVQSGYCNLDFTITNLAPGVLTLAVTAVNFFPAAYKDGSPGMQVNINITSIPKGANPQSYSNMAMKAFNSAQARSSVINSINATLNAPGNLQMISNLLTNVIDGYLKANRMYPFDQATFAIA